jgi:membrane-associated PAP2 superfamily phosphatase
MHDTSNSIPSRSSGLRSILRGLSPVYFLWLPLALIATGSILVHLFNLDLRVSAVFWDPDNGWTHLENPFFVFLYRYGPVPVFMGAVGALLILIFRRGGTESGMRSRTCVIIILLLALGPGLFINALFKEHYGRPRPRSIEQFGGEEAFVPLFIYNPEGDGKSFPSGHASMGFFWLGLVPLAFASSRRKTGWALLAAGLVHGVLMSLGRIAQGGHFLSDVMWSAAMDYFIGLALMIALFPARGSLSDNRTASAITEAEPSATGVSEG